jgi:hypothetical protein
MPNESAAEWDYAAADQGSRRQPWPVRRRAERARSRPASRGRLFGLDGHGFQSRAAERRGHRHVGGVVAIATSEASRPRPMTTRPLRLALLRGSKVHHWSPSQASIQAAKSIGAGSGGTSMSGRYPKTYRAGMFSARQNEIARWVKSRQTPRPARLTSTALDGYGPVPEARPARRQDRAHARVAIQVGVAAGRHRRLTTTARLR